MIQTSSSCSVGAGAAAAPAATGTSVSARTSDAASAAITAAASGRYMRPSMPVIAKSGRKTAMTISVAKAIGRPTSMRRRRAPRSRRGAAGCRCRRCTTFSVTMIAASTSRPTAMARPPSVIVLRPMPAGAQEQARRARSTAAA